MKQKQFQILKLEGMVPPQAPELELAILGAMCLEREAVQTVFERINKHEVFYDFRHQLIFQAMINLKKAGSPIDILTVIQELRKMGKLKEAGTHTYVSSLTNSIGMAANVDTHAKVVVEKFLLRETQQVSLRSLQMTMDDSTDVFDLHFKFSREMSELMSSSVKQDAIAVRELVKPMIDEVTARMDNPENQTGVKTSIRDLQKKIVDYGKTDLIIIAARPGMGKSGFMMSELYDMALSGIPSAVFSLEMSRNQLMFRLASQVTGIDVQDLSKRKLSDSDYEKLHKEMGKLERLPIYIDDTPGLSVHDCRTKTKRLVSKYGIKMVAVDYLQLMTGDQDGANYYKGNREQEVSSISRTLKLIAKECDIPVMALSQLSREVEGKADKRPVLKDLRESGAIEQDADMVGFIYRPAYYSDKDHPEDYAEFVIRKCRNGSLGIAKMKFTAQTASFSSWDNGQTSTNFYEKNEDVF